MKNFSQEKIFIFLLIVFTSALFFSKKSAFSASNITINEFLVHPDSANKEWVEFYNPDHLDLSNYWLDDDADFNNDAGSSAKKSLSTINNSDPTYPYLEFSSFLNNSGDNVVLFSSDGTIIDQYSYNEDPGVNKSMGRYPDGTGAIVLLSASTKGFSNGMPLPTATSTPVPTSTPFPTNTPTPTLKPTSTPKPAPTSTTSLPVNKTINTITISPVITLIVREEKKDTIAENVLGDNITSESSVAKISNSQISPTIMLETLGTTNNNLSKIFIALGVIFIVSCGILAFKSYRKKLKEFKQEI